MTPGPAIQDEDPDGMFQRRLDAMINELLGEPDTDDSRSWAARVVDGVHGLRGVAAVQIVRPGGANPVLAAAGPSIDPSASTILCHLALSGDHQRPHAVSNENLPDVHALLLGPQEALVLRLSGAGFVSIEALARALPPAAIAARRLHELHGTEQMLGTHREIERNIAESMSSVSDLDGLGRAVIRITSLLFDVEQSAIYFREPTGNPLRLVASHGFEAWEMEAAARTAWDRHPGRVFRTGQTLVVDDVRLDPRSTTDNTARRFEVRSRCWIPVSALGEVVGALGAASPRVAAFGEEHVQGLTFLADLAGLTWSRLMEQGRRETRDRILIAAGEATETLLSARRWRDVLPDLLEGIRSAFDAQSVRFVEPDGTSTGQVPEDPPISTEFVEMVLAAEAGGITGSGGEDERLPRRQAKIPHPFAAVPVIARERVAGVLLVTDAHDGRVHDQNSIAALRAFADPLASKIARDRMEDSVRQIDRMDALGQLAGGVAHDINNLLMPVLGLASRLAETEPEPERRHQLESIQLAAERGRDFVEQVLLLTRRRVATEEQTRIAPAVEEAVRLLRPTIRTDIDLVLDIEEPDATVAGDRTAILRMIQNLLANGAQAIEKGATGSVRTRVARRDRDGSPRVIISVEDDGCGIPDDVRKRLFDPFFTTRRSPAERGLGLTIVHRIATELGGIIEVSSEPERGTTFRIDLPLSKTPAASTTTPARPLETTPPGEPKDDTDAWILVVDDDEMVRSTTRALVESLGHVVRDAVGGAEALEVIAEDPTTPPRLVLTDLSMPGMDGIELVRRLRGDGYEGAAAVITGYGEDAFEPARDAGVDVVLRKPISRRELGEAIDRLLEAAS